MQIKTYALFGKKNIKYVKANINPEIKNNKVLVRIIYSGLCRSQLMEIDMKRGKDKFLPHMFGHEAIGEVVKVGKNVKKVKINDKIVASWIKGKGLSSSGDQLEINKKKINYGPISTISNYSIISEDRCFPVSKNFPEKIGSFFGCSILTGAGMVLNKFKLKSNDFILVIGVGGVGFASLLALKAKNIKNVVILDTNIKKKKLVNKLGYNLFFKPNVKNLLSKLKKITKGRLFDYCFESSGSIKSIEQGFNYINYSGSLLFASHPQFQKKIKLDPHELIKGKKIYGSWGGGAKPDKDIEKIFKLFKRKNILKFIDTKTYSMKDLKIAIKDFRDGKVLRPIIKMSH